MPTVTRFCGWDGSGPSPLKGGPNSILHGARDHRHRRRRHLCCTPFKVIVKSELRGRFCAFDILQKKKR
ncbi:hypothetical protein Nepgr_025929 [Nepenthes gracilis]|uniref:Uncharacterized protein n=1 Tax=Nepenthes gracilis TaxID=150966 RepID=A0AAD3T7M4_NEPGR|nr:hypothetical protein Nepgr_025929 [Nepenthes gracilis]